jgi:hypothetical protein
MVVRT